MIRLFSLLFIMITCITNTWAQSKQYGKIKLIEESGITALLAQNEENLEGYRIQIFTGGASERQKAQSIKASVESNYGINAYIDYESPLFKVRVGDFPDKLNAIALKHQLKKEYANAYLVKVKRINP